jgi:DNA transformation protein and related proteins
MGERRDPHRFDDLFSAFGPITLRRFFGGEGICAGEIMFGMIFGERLYFKTDAHTRDAFLAEACEPFTFEKAGETVVTGWYALPDRLYDDPEELARWAQQALAVAAASETAAKKQRKRFPGITARQPRGLRKRR